MGRGTVTVPAHGDPRFVTGMSATETVNRRGLERHLRRHVTGEVRFDPGSLAMYANDSSNFRQVPIGVVVPRTLDDVVQTAKACATYRAPITVRGGGTSLSGETVNNAVIVDVSKYLTGVGEVDVAGRRVTCEPGVINEQLNRKTGEHGLVFGPDPSSHSRCTIGGNLGNNSCGIHSVQSRHYGPGPRTSDNTEALEVVTYDGERFWVGVGEEERLDEIIAAGGRKGEIYAKLRDLRDRYADDIRAGFPSVEELPRRVSGYNLDELLPERGFNVARALVGTEGTCAIALQSTLLLTPGMYAAHDRADPVRRRCRGRRGHRGHPGLEADRAGDRRPPAHPRPAAEAPERGGAARAPPARLRGRLAHGPVRRRHRPGVREPVPGLRPLAAHEEGLRRPTGSRWRSASRRAASASSCGPSARAAWAPPPSRPTATTTGRAGRTPPSPRGRPPPTSAT